MKYPVAEIFTSIQGEGFFTGQPANFIRLAGCNLSCAFCDTDYSVKERLSQFEIAERLNPTLRRVVITGGEPLIHNLADLVLHLDAKGYKLHLETNGSLECPYENRFTWISISPKQGAQSVVLGHEAKWLIPMWSYEDIDWNIAGYHFLQPINHKLHISSVNLRRCLQLLYSQKAPMPLRLSVQLHKLIGVK